MDLCSKNASLRNRRHQFRIGFYSVFCLSDTFLGFAVRMHFRFKKPTKNPSKTRSDTSKNRCWKHFVFRYRFFHVLGSILESLGPPRLSQVGHFGLQKLGTISFWALLNKVSPKNGVLEATGLEFGASGLDLGRVWPRFWSFWNAPRHVFEGPEPTFGLLFARLVRPTFGVTCWQL